MVDIEDERKVPLVGRPQHYLTNNREYALPRSPKISRVSTWVQPGQAIEVAGLTLTAGLFYFGTGLKDSHGNAEPSLISPKKDLDDEGDFIAQSLGYYPSYASISSSARRAYLNWISQGRSHPQAHIGFVFLHLYGLERRVLLDIAGYTELVHELPIIAIELRRLLSIYSKQSASFRGYATQLLDWVETVRHEDHLYKSPVPQFERRKEGFPMYLLVALGQTVRDQAPLPAELALAWMRADSQIVLKMPARRFIEKFDTLFKIRYQEIYGNGLLLSKPISADRLKHRIRPSSSALQGYGTISLIFDDLYNLGDQVQVTEDLQGIADLVADELENYNRYVTRNPQDVDAYQAVLCLPTALWSSSILETFNYFKEQVEIAPIQGELGKVFREFGPNVVDQDILQNIAKVLLSKNVGIEPDILRINKKFKLSDQVVLFSHQGLSEEQYAIPNFQLALTTLQLAAAFSERIQEVSQEKIGHIFDQIKEWEGLTPAHFERLAATVRLFSNLPLALTLVKPRIHELSDSRRQFLASIFLETLRVNEQATPNEVRNLEKLYQVLGLSSEGLFSEIHARNTGTIRPKERIGPDISVKKIPTVGPLVLDTTKISGLQQDTEKVSALLSDIFSQESEELAIGKPSSDLHHGAEQEPGAANEVSRLATSPTNKVTHPAKQLLGLDDSHGALAKLLLSQIKWSRSDLLSLANGLDLMLDGALEQLNDAAFDAYDIPFTEGDDPVEVNSDLIEILKYDNTDSPQRP